MENFVYPEHPDHAPYRKLTRRGLEKFHFIVPFGVPPSSHLLHQPSSVPKKVIFPEGAPRFAVSKEDRNSWFYGHGGVNLSESDLYVDRGIRPVAMRLHALVDPRLVLGSPPVAYEILNYGVGAFQELRTPCNGGLELALGKRPLPRISSHHAKIQIEHLVPSHGVYGTTNLIHADVLGELEQIHDRRKDEVFLRNYLKGMKAACKTSCDEELESELRSPKGIHWYYHSPELCRAWLAHADLGLWDTTPRNPDELIDRVDFILEKTETDTDVLEVWDYEDMKLTKPIKRLKA
jgi:hypothetical protein